MEETYFRETSQRNFWECVINVSIPAEQFESLRVDSEQMYLASKTSTGNDVFSERMLSSSYSGIGGYRKGQNSKWSVCDGVNCWSICIKRFLRS
ncbi:hypothetical protein TNIN_215031 [Trichonephila inaurata madagascariensis]|uniref:Uncharacterized protein n=1 Tax=Trichonephila inaurata madagascariensis TaxID=2747483 RepID=A0A8X7CE85_9ARAC|nr:hypothetical protein TNIN_215031 [Trichonephila inaurata madagascariensis]